MREDGTGTPSASQRSTIPRIAKSSSVRGRTVSAFECGERSALFSSTTTSTPAILSSAASQRPTGPPAGDDHVRVVSAHLSLRRRAAARAARRRARARPPPPWRCRARAVAAASALWPAPRRRGRSARGRPASRWSTSVRSPTRSETSAASPWDEDERARTRPLARLVRIADPEGDLALEDVEGLVVARLAMPRRRESLPPTCSTTANRPPVCSPEARTVCSSPKNQSASASRRALRRERGHRPRRSSGPPFTSRDR